MNPSPLITRAAIRCGSFCLDLVFPRFCVSCRAEGNQLCSRCIALLPEAAQRCPFCAVPSPRGACCYAHRVQALSSVLAVYAYDDPLVSQIIHQWKYGPMRPIGPRLLERMEENQWQSWISDLSRSIDIIVPVPLHRRKQRERGFNQSEDLARLISERSRVPVVPLLCREKHRPAQASFSSRESRLENASGIFALNPNIYLAGSAPRILLIDDVITTGATLESAAMLLRSISPVVHGWCLARGEAINQDSK